MCRTLGLPEAEQVAPPAPQRAEFDIHPIAGRMFCFCLFFGFLFFFMNTLNCILNFWLVKYTNHYNHSTA